MFKDKPPFENKTSLFSSVGTSYNVILGVCY